jgi:hypothetical protein
MSGHLNNERYSYALDFIACVHAGRADKGIIPTQHNIIKLTNIQFALTP